MTAQGKITVSRISSGTLVLVTPVDSYLDSDGDLYWTMSRTKVKDAHAARVVGVNPYKTKNGTRYELVADLVEPYDCRGHKIVKIMVDDLVGHQTFWLAPDAK